MLQGRSSPVCFSTCLAPSAHPAAQEHLLPGSGTYLQGDMGFPGGLEEKYPPANAENMGWMPGTG